MRDISSPLDGFSSPFGPQRNRTLQSLLFGQTEPGFTFEPWDITTLYQDRAGTTPVTAAGQSVGYRRDKSGNGNHEVAISDAKRGVYGWLPKTGRRNLLTYTEQFDNAVWQKNNLTITANTSAAPDGTTKADTLTGSGSGGTFLRGPAVTSAAAVIVSFYVKSGTATTCTIGDVNIGALAVFNLSTGTVASGAGASISSSGNGWYRCAVTYTPVSSTTGFTINPGSSLAPVTTGSILIWGAQLEAGSTATAYQRVASQYDVTEAGVPTCYYVQADGVDDAYVTPTITPGTDKVQVFAGVRKNSNAAAGILIEHSATFNSNAGSLVITAPEDASGKYNTASRGDAASTSTQAATTGAIGSPDSAVITATHDIAGDLSTIRRNGVAGTNSVADKGTGNFLAYPAYIYSRGGTSLPFNGLDFGHAVRFGPNLDAATIARVESLIARNTPEVTL